MFDCSEGKPPALDRENEKKVQDFCLELIHNGLISSAHDCSEGGLAVAVAESCFSPGCMTLGASLMIESTLRNDTLLFGETQSRVVVSFPKERINKIKDLAESFSVNFSLIGIVGGSHLKITINGKEVVKQEIELLKKIWKNSLGNYAGQTT